jgi:hypothetical protein
LLSRSSWLWLGPVLLAAGCAAAPPPLVAVAAPAPAENVVPGMTIEDVLQSRWGRPKRIELGETADGQYARLRYSFGALYLLNGRVIRITIID